MQADQVLKLVRLSEKSNKLSSTLGQYTFEVFKYANKHAIAQGFYVLYPEQSQDANPSRCWNWFNHNHQQRDRGEPALLAEMTLEIIRTHRIDPSRVYIAGLSAGATGQSAGYRSPGHRESLSIESTSG